MAEIAAAVPPGGALVLPVLTGSAGFAFVVVDGAAEPIVIDPLPLDGLAVAEYLSGEDGWLGVYHEQFRDRRQDDDGGKAQRAAAARWEGKLAATLVWLWERLLGRVDAYLKNEARLRAEAPVALLMPGLLGVLPLQAAGSGPDGRYFCESWTVSHAPSVRALLACRQRAERRRDRPARLLAVIDPPGGGPELRGAQDKVPPPRRFVGDPGRVAVAVPILVRPCRLARDVVAGKGVRIHREEPRDLGADGGAEIVLGDERDDLVTFVAPSERGTWARFSSSSGGSHPVNSAELFN
jgi:hypothetical protein